MKHRVLTFRRTVIICGLLCLALFFTVTLSLSIGSVAIPFSKIWQIILRRSVESTDSVIILQLRLPRILLAMTVGAALATTGAVFQAIFRNPLAEPYILGISSGGTVGTLIAFGLGLTFLAPLFSFTGSLSVMGLVFFIGRRRGQLDTTTLLLTGVMAGAFFNAIILLLLSIYNQELRTAYLWLLGNLSSTDIGSITFAAIVVLGGAITFFTQARAFNVLATGEEYAHQLGINVKRLKILSYLVASIMIGISVSITGVIGFVGLMVPHVCRRLFGPDHRILFPASFLVGAIFLLLSDLLSRTLIAPTEIPVGAVTAALGAPFFISLLHRK